MTKFVGIASGKGGVGKTTTAINLGMALNNFGKDVIVIDANLKTPNLCLHLGASKVPVTLHDVINGKNRISEATYKHISGLRIIPASISFEDSKMARNKVLGDVLLDLYGRVDIALIDISGGLGEEASEAIKACDNLLIIITPDTPSVTDALKTIKLAEEQGVNVFGVIINKTNEDDELSVKNIETILEKPVVGSVPYDNNIKKSLKIKHPVVYSNPEAPASLSYKKLAATLLGEEFKETTQKGSLLNRIAEKLLK